jgi:calmodulin
MMTGGRSRQSAPEPTPAAAAPAPASAPAPNTEGDTEADYETAWKEFDPSLKGSITAAQFRQLMAGLGENVTDAEVDELIGTVDAEDKISCKLSFRLGVRDGMESELTMMFFSQRICSVC